MGGDGADGSGGDRRENGGDRQSDDRRGGDRQGGSDDRRSESEGDSRRDEGGTDDQPGSGGGVPTAEKAVIAVSVLFTLSLFAYAGWQIATPPAVDDPQVTVVGTEPADGGVAVTVRLRNPKDVGLVSATVQADCAAPPPQVEFSYVPAASTRTGTVVCPPGTTDPSASLANWVTR